MDESDLQAARDALATARRDARPIADWPASRRPSTLAEAYRLQREVAGSFGRVRGWKVAAITPAQRASLGVDHCLCAPLLEPYVQSADGRDASWPLAAFIAPKLECEFAFELGRDLPARSDRPYGRDEVEAAVAGLRLAVEIVDSRLPALDPPPVAVAVADAFSNGAFVCGPLVVDWRRVDFAAQRIVLRADRDGVRSELAAGSGRAILDGDPLGALLQLANAPPSGERGLLAGDVVTTGSCTGAPYAPGRGRYEAEFGIVGDGGALGRIAVVLS